MPNRTEEVVRRKRNLLAIIVGAILLIMAGSLFFFMPIQLALIIYLNPEVMRVYATILCVLSLIVILIGVMGTKIPI